ncbi:N5-glutamine S-adenosyl-L-methionine-dependent methyltransferase [Hyphomicrobium denitrificans 1NES1]|uniref:Release factor glutamine methyltransferase n=1 Tax=Hyphomicrobium denitrificans 1NES1 TaxID=670307 RepID=N0B8U4_9HYPH|nr:peptide chain release factor N(5)-glutamine methyltransferase [Hyphomicrobium denitrificans]AGK60014.1 N5-glutamine S-adenosyl-L-methionine-dependent methyltransferase [Hyphomicrobium denitrificans 1NES1]
MAAQQQGFERDQTVGAALAEMTRAFAAQGIESAPRDARILLQGLLGVDGTALLTRPEQRLGDAAARIGDAVRRRLAREPVSRILGVREFYGREFLVTPDVLDPRPDTETVVDLALEIVRSNGLQSETIHIADIGTGSGILIATLLAELPNARGVATDISAAALAVAQRNADRLGVAGRASFVATHRLDGCAGPFDLVVSNPPYIVTGEISGLEPEVRDYDPQLALDGGVDGLGVYREIAGIARNPLRPMRLVMEVGATQASDVTDIFSAYGWQPLDQKKDLGGHVRAVAVEIHP